MMPSLFLPTTPLFSPLLSFRGFCSPPTLSIGPPNHKPALLQLLYVFYSLLVLTTLTNWMWVVVLRSKCVRCCVVDDVGGVRGPSHNWALRHAAEASGSGHSSARREHHVHRVLGEPSYQPFSSLACSFTLFSHGFTLVFSVAVSLMDGLKIGAVAVLTHAQIIWWH